MFADLIFFVWKLSLRWKLTRSVTAQELTPFICES